MKYKIQRWILKKICKDWATQGFSHEKLITEYLGIMYKQCQENFTEDPPYEGTYGELWLDGHMKFTKENQ